MKTTTLIACPIFKEELELLPPTDSVVNLLDYKIHIDARFMEQELRNAVADNKKQGADIALLLGCECKCMTSIREIGEDTGAKHPLEKNCLEIILGSERVLELQKNRTSIITRGWINMVQTFIESGTWTEVDARISFGHYDRLLLLDYGGTPLSDEEIINFYDLVQVPIEIEQVDLDIFKSNLDRLTGS